MMPLSLLAAQTVAAKLTEGDALPELVTALASEGNVSLPPLSSGQILLSSAPSGLADRNAEFTYPRVCIYSTGVRNTQIEKFRSFSGITSMVAEIWASGDLITDVDAWIHFYVAGVTTIPGNAAGDWANGLAYMGTYEVQFETAKIGGLGFVQSARVSFDVAVSLNRQMT